MKYFSVPAFEPNRSRWIEAIEAFQSFDYVVQTFHVCSRHFLPSDIIVKGKRKTVKPGAVPSLFTNVNAEKQMSIAQCIGGEIEPAGSSIDQDSALQSIPVEATNNNSINDFGQIMTQNLPNICVDNINSSSNNGFLIDDYTDSSYIESFNNNTRLMDSSDG